MRQFTRTLQRCCVGVEMSSVLCDWNELQDQAKSGAELKRSLFGEDDDDDGACQRAALGAAAAQT